MNITLPRAVVQQAYEALERCTKYDQSDYDAMTALRAALERHDEYERANPLGGPSKVFEAIAAAIRSGDDYHAVMRAYGLVDAERPQPSGETLAQREAVCAAWHALPDELRKDDRMGPLYRALGGSSVGRTLRRWRVCLTGE